MLQRLGIRGKLLAVVAVPTIVLLIVASFVVLTAAADLSSARNTAQLVEVVQRGSLLVEDVQAERATVSNYLRSVIDGQNGTAAARADVEAALETIAAAGENDPAYAAVAQGVIAATTGANGAEGLDAYREITDVPPVEEGFPAWPEPDAVAITTAGLERIADEVDAAATAAPVSDIGTVIRGLGDLIAAEAEETATYLNEAKLFSDALPDTFAAVDRTGNEFIAASEDVAERSDNAAVLDFTSALRTRLSNIDGLRGQIRSRNLLPGNAEAAYGFFVTDVFQLTREVANSAANRELAAYLGAFQSMNELYESVRVEQEYVSRKIRQGEWVAGEPAVFQGLYFGSNNALANAQLAADGLPGIPDVPSFGVSYDVNERTGFQTVRDRLLADTSDAALLDQRNAEWEVQVGEELDAMAPVRAEILDQVRQGASASVRDALVQLLTTIAIAAIVFVLTLIVTLSIARRIVNPLRRLTTTVTAVRQELPRLVERVALPGQSVDLSEVQIPVESQDEVGRLAEAFNSVNAATLSIAAEQAALRGSISEMFVNVARRDQVLLNRQLSSIDEMERTEDNQTTLTKLFALDHLATRMRRNSESLLVLAGIDTGRRLRRPMPLSDVIRTASSEIELYERVQLELDADPSMLGHSALTAAHMFAELLENATVFSDPGAPVVVRTMADGDNVVVEVLDSGIGMTPQELAEANARVASTAASEILGAQRLGLFVVGRIARRVGARVQLESVEGEGTVARIVMPPALFDASATYEPVHQSSTAVDESTHAPAALVHHSVADSEVRDPIPGEEHLPVASANAYQPTVIEGGASLFGRPVEAPVTADSSDAPQDEPSAGLDSLVAADAASAPEAEPVDLDALTGGVTPSGLPTRRRKSGEPGVEAPQETNSIIGLPMRASDAQLTALESATTSGFTPILAANEVSPESAEQRARVFRGFRPLRGDAEDASTPVPDAESHGHAARRGAPAVDAAVEAAAPGPEPIPALAPDANRAGDDVQAPAAPESVPSPFAVEAADPRHTESPVVRQSPLIARGYAEDADSGESPLVPSLGGGPTQSMGIPVLEEDEPEAAPPGPWEQVGGEPSAGVESVALDDSQYPEEATAPPQGVGKAPAPSSPTGYRTPLYPAPPAADVASTPSPQGAPVDADDGQRQSPQGQSPQFESDPVTSTPSLDELIMDGSHGLGSEGRGGFFSRLFGRDGKHEQPSEANVPREAPTSKAPEVAPTEHPAPVDAAVQEPFAPTATPQAPAATPSLHANDEREQSAPFASDVRPSDREEPRQREDTSMWIGRVPAARFDQPERPAPGQGGPGDGHSAWESELPAQGAVPTPPAGSGGAPLAFTPDLTRNERFDDEWSLPGRSAAPTPSTAPEAAVPGDSHAAYSPDQLARPLGWEAAGASALQAAAPEAATEYRPVVQIEPQATGDGFADFSSEVFSELSSLAAERPKVEKTNAGLVKRTPVERSTEPEKSADVAAPEVPRDAEAVRHRFSSFYSGTQRAREDVKSFKESTQGSLTEP